MSDGTEAGVTIGVVLDDICPVLAAKRTKPSAASAVLGDNSPGLHFKVSRKQSLHLYWRPTVFVRY